MNLTNPLNPRPDAIASQARGKNRFQVGFRARAGQVEVRFAERVDQRANDVCAADRDATRRPDVGAKAIEKHDLAVEQDDGHLRPVLRMRWAPSALLGSVGGSRLVVGNEDVLAALADSLS